MFRYLSIVALLVSLAILGAVVPGLASAFENVNMNTSLNVENGRIVVRWNPRGFDHYNIRWTENGGAPTQVERDGDKDFRYLSPFRPGVVYSVAVQGCDKSFASSSRCTSWDEASCGTARNPCDGNAPRPIMSRGGLCLDVHAPDQRRNGGRVQLWKCNGSDQQLWSVSSGRLVSLTGKCLDVHAPDLRNNGGRVQVWDCNGSVQQHWAKHGLQLRSGGGLCLDAHLPALHQNGAVVQVWGCNGQIQQQWSQSGL